MAATPSRRLVLRVALKLLALAALAALTVTFVASLLPARPPRESLTLDTGQLAPDQVLRAEWQGRRYIVLRRSAPIVAGLPGLAPFLADPDSRHSEQPAPFATPLRSAGAEFFAALDYDPDFGCPLEYLPPGAAAPVSPWFGGFHAPCSDSWFDPAGRVYRNQRTLHNLRVPPSRRAGESLVLDQ